MPRLPHQGNEVVRVTHAVAHLLEEGDRVLRFCSAKQIQFTVHSRGCFRLELYCTDDLFLAASWLLVDEKATTEQVLKSLEN